VKNDILNGALLIESGKPSKEVIDNMKIPILTISRAWLMNIPLKDGTTFKLLTETIKDTKKTNISQVVNNILETDEKTRVFYTVVTHEEDVVWAKGKFSPSDDKEALIIESFEILTNAIELDALNEFLPEWLTTYRDFHKQASKESLDLGN